jgi:hypothetical protein
METATIALALVVVFILYLIMLKRAQEHFGNNGLAIGVGLLVLIGVGAFMMSRTAKSGRISPAVRELQKTATPVIEKPLVDKTADWPETQQEVASTNSQIAAARQEALGDDWYEQCINEQEYVLRNELSEISGEEAQKSYVYIYPPVATTEKKAHCYDAGTLLQALNQDNSQFVETNESQTQLAYNDVKSKYKQSGASLFRLPNPTLYVSNPEVLKDNRTSVKFALEEERKSGHLWGVTSIKTSNIVSGAHGQDVGMSVYRLVPKPLNWSP